MEYSILTLVPVVAGIGEALRIAGLPCKYVPFTNLAIGLIIGIIICNTNLDGCVIDGLVVGLGASGLTRSSQEVNCMLNNRRCCQEEKNRKKKHKKKK